LQNSNIFVWSDLIVNCEIIDYDIVATINRASGNDI